jgi:metallo-beta-lactamase class B
MHSSIRTVVVAFAMLIIFSSPSFSQVSEPGGPGIWTKEYKPFHIAGNLYYVGTYDLACYLIVTTEGNILVNTGVASSADVIKKNIESLGFKFGDLKILLTTQAHWDHMGAMSAIKKQTGAKFMVDAADAPAAADGGKSDYAFGGNVTFEPINADRLLKDGDKIRLGDTELTIISHHGHTKGSCSYSLTVKDELKSYKVLIANFPSIVTDKKFTDLTTYPTIAKDYADSFASLKKQNFDLWVASHASQFNLHAKRKEGDVYNPELFADRKLFDETVADLEENYKKRVGK